MDVYKVIFEHNVAIAARKVDFRLRKSVKVKDKEIKWLPVFAESEQESIQIANRLVNFYLRPTRAALAGR